MEYVKTQYANVLKGKVEDIGIAWFEFGKSTNSIPLDNAVNGTFFMHQASDKRYFSTSPLVIDGKAYRWEANNSPCRQSCFIIYKDNKVEMKRLKNISELDLNKVKHILAGIGLVNKFDSSFKYDPKCEGFSDAVLRECEKTVIATRGDEIFLLTAKDLFHSHATKYDLLDLCKSHEFDIAMSLDGSGSTFLKADGEYKQKGDGRLVANAVYFKGKLDVNPQNPSQVKQKLVILSDGHGENTAGKRSHQFDDGYVLKENHFNEPVVDYIKANLSKYKCEVCHVSDGKEDTSLKVRTDKANKAYKDMCDKYGKENVDCIYVSIHANHDGSTSWSQANGIDTFAYPKSDKTLHTLLLNKLIAATGLRNRGVKEENFHELRETAMTACLCECGFMSNLNEATLLRSDEYRRKCANAITDGIVEYMKLEKVAEDKPVEPPKVDENVYWRVIVSSPQDINEARKLEEELKSKGYKDTFISKYIKN